MDISIVILSWNDREHLQECLESLQHCTKSRSLEIIVVDNASTDGSPELVTERFPYVTLIRNPENLGFPKGNNIGVRASKGDYVFLLNSDIKVLDGCIDELADFMDKHSDIGMLGPRILNDDMTLQSSCRRFPTLWNNFCTATGLATLLKESRLFSGEHMRYFKGDRIMDVEVLVGCFWMVRRKALDQFGLLDEGFFIYAEDVDWCKRCWKAGWRVVFFPEAQAIHYRGTSTTKKDPVRFALTQQQSVLRYWQKHHGSLGRVSISCLIFSHLSLRWTATLMKFILGSSPQAETRVRMRVTNACLRALFLHHGL
jgi:GT2 family glycosyltransferase